VGVETLRAEGSARRLGEASVVLAGGTDAEILAWGQQTGRTLTEHDLLIWNSFAQKRGWRDDASANLIKHKAAAGLGHRDDIETFFAFFEVDEGRAPR
jgi:hypothetical protein